MVSWLAGRVVLFVFIFALLMVVFAVSRAPRLIVAHFEGELQRAVEELEEVRQLSGEAAKQAALWQEQIGGAVAMTQQLEEKRRRLEGWFARLSWLFQPGGRDGEMQKIDAEIRKLESAQARLETDLAELHAVHGETEEELRRREIVRDTKRLQLEQARDVRRWLDAFMRGEVGRLAWAALGILLLITLLPAAWRVLAYFALAPNAERAPPIVLDAPRELALLPVCSESSPAKRITIGTGGELLAKGRYLQSSTDNSEKRTRWLFDPRFPFTSVAAGLFLLTRFRPQDGECTVTLSCQHVATEELAVVDLPEGAALAFRPTCLAAMLVNRTRPPKVRSRWVFNRLQAWIDLRFRHLIIEGPAQLVFAGQRGMQPEQVVPSVAGRRINSGLTAAFTPSLEYSPRRAETFVAYFRGASPLFDDFFRGQGLTINQQVGGGGASGARRLWAGFFNAIGKIFGL